MTERELVQTTLANLPRPTPPPRLRRAVMAQVTAEARLEAAGPQVQTWHRSQGGGWVVEWRQGKAWPEPEAVRPAARSSVFRCARRQDAAGTTVSLFTQTRY
jgi:hypothetical protein